MQNEDQYLRECLRIDESNINAEYVRLPADLAYWNARYAEVYQEWNESKLYTEQMVAQLSIAMREQLANAAKGSRVTVGEVEQTVQCLPQYQQARQAEIAAESEKVRLHGIVDALRAKREMLVSLGAHMRMEMQNDPLIRANAATDAQVRRAAQGV